MDWGFSSGRVAAVPVVSGLISAGSGMEICFQISVVSFVENVYTYCKKLLIRNSTLTLQRITKTPVLGNYNLRNYLFSQRVSLPYFN